MSARILRAEEPKLCVDVDICLPLILGDEGVFWWAFRAAPTDGGT